LTRRKKRINEKNVSLKDLCREERVLFNISLTCLKAKTKKKKKKKYNKIIKKKCYFHFHKRAFSK
jgi:hypothetical protein